MTLAPEFLPIVQKSWFVPADMFASWRRERKAQRRHIKALRDLVASPGWLLDDIGLSRNELRAELDAAERGDLHRAAGPNASPNHHGHRDTRQTD